jgi:glycerol-3-phosphate acyltransferase PlsY
VIEVLLIFTFAFLIGSIPFGLFVGRLFGLQDIRKTGSGNIGATNVARARGLGPGLLTLGLDSFKGVLPVFILTLSGTEAVLDRIFNAIGLPSQSINISLIWWTGFFAVAGHCFSPWLKFRGGKGVATGLGVILILSPWAALSGIVAFVFTGLRNRRVSLASIAGLSLAAVVELVLHGVSVQHWAGLCMVWLIIARHERNLSALLDNTEPEFVLGRAEGK